MAEGSKTPSTQDDTANSQNVLNDSFVNLIGRQSKLFEEFGKHQTKVFEEFGKQQTKIFVEFGNKMSIELQTSYQEYLKQQVENTVKAEKNSLQFEKVCRKYEEDIVSLRARIEELESESIIKNQNVDNLLQVTNNLKKDFQLILENNNNQVEFQDVDNENCKVLEIPEIDSKDDNCKIPEEEPSLTKDENCKVLEIPELINQLVSSNKMLERTGKEVMLKANFIDVTNFSYPKIHYYSFEVFEHHRSIVRRSDSDNVFRQMLLSKIFGPNTLPVYDFVRLIYSPTELAIGHSKKTRNHYVTIPAETDRSGRERSFKVEIKHQGKIILNTIGDYVRENSKTPLDESVLNSIFALNAFLNNKYRSEYLSVGRMSIFPHDNSPNYLPGGIEMKHGFVQSIRPGWGRLVINVDIVAATFYPAIPVIDIIPQIIKDPRDRDERSKDDLRRGLERKEIDVLNRYLKRVSVFVKLGSDYRKQKYKVSRVDHQPADVAKFKQGNKVITVAKYLRDTYGRTLQFARLPCIVVVKPQNNSKTYFPVEVCEICPGQKYIHKLPVDAQREMVRITTVRPQDRFDSIERAIKENFKYNDNENLRSIGLVTDSELIQVKARVLPPPKLTSNDTNFNPQGGRWYLRRFTECPDIYNWSIMVFENRFYFPPEVIKNAMKILRNSLCEKGLNISMDPPIVYGSPHGDYEKSLALACQKARIRKDRPPQLIVCIIQRKVLGNSGIYSQIKRICGTILGVVSQCVVANNMKGHNPNRWRMICDNLALKINGKLGGKNSVLDDRELNFGTNKPYMVFGADVVHQVINRPSIAAVCASMDKSITRYVGRYSMNRNIRNEIIENLEGMVIELLIQFQRRNNVLPFQIVFYRDGVSEGQFERVLHEEVMALKRAFDRVYGYKNQKPQLTFIIVQKHHRVRFMPVRKEDSDRSGNCQPGTVVDTEIVVPQEFVFYLQSHATPLGTARPTRYYVLLNEAKFTADAIQYLTYKLCHVSARCNVAISLVTPVSYARHIANQAKGFLKRDVSSNDVTNFTCERIKSEIENMMYFV